MPAYCRTEAYNAFADELPLDDDDRQQLFRAAFAIARHEYPEANVDQAQQLLDGMGKSIADRVRSANPEARLAHLHDMLFDVIGFTGNVEDYYNPANSYLPHVLATHRGLPISLVLIYKYVGEAAGLSIRGINSPGHFLAAVNVTPKGADAGDGQRNRWMYVDPFYGGELLDSADVCRRIAETTGLVADNPAIWLSPASHRQWISRMLNNLQAVFAHTGRERDLYAMQELQELLV